MWAYESVFYQIYPLGFCGAPFENDGVLDTPDPKGKRLDSSYSRSLAQTPSIFHRSLNRTPTDTIPEITRRSTHALAQTKILRKCVTTFTAEGIKVVLDGVFNHVGRGFWAFQDVLEKRWDSPYKDWFHISL